MIKLTKINGSAVVVNADLVETITPTPDTLIALVTGKTVKVRDSVDEVIRKVTEYRKEVSGKVTLIERKESTEE